MVRDAFGKLDEKLVLASKVQSVRRKVQLLIEAVEYHHEFEESFKEYAQYDMGRSPGVLTADKRKNLYFELPVTRNLIVSRARCLTAELREP